MNKIYLKDNLVYMKTLNNNYIDLIYADILYGTGRDFKDYKDLKSEKDIIYDHYVPRIKEMRRILKNDGLIYLQMDHRIIHWIRCIMDDIFGYENFRNEIIWHYNSAPRKKNCFGNRHDTILRYSKSDKFTFNAIREPYSLSAPRGYKKEKYYNKDGKVIGDVWKLNMIAQNDKTERVDYKTQKPKSLLKQIILSSSNEGELIFDPYMGSGTTCVVAKELNRNYLGCDNSEKSILITKERLKKLVYINIKIK